MGSDSVPDCEWFSLAVRHEKKSRSDKHSKSHHPLVIEDTRHLPKPPCCLDSVVKNLTRTVVSTVTSAIDQERTTQST